MSNQVWQWQFLSKTRISNNNTWYDVYKHSCLNVDEHKQHFHQQHCRQIKRSSFWTSWRQWRKTLEPTSMRDNHQHTHHNHKAASNDTTVHWWDKYEPCYNKSPPATTSHWVYNIQSYHGLWDMQHGYWTDTPLWANKLPKEMAKCEMAEPIQYMIPTARTQPKMEPRCFKGIWLGRDTMIGESIVGGIPGKIIRVRTIRRQIMHDKYDKQLLDTINVYPWNTPTPPMTIQPQLLLPANPQASSYTVGTQTTIPMDEMSAQTQQAGAQPALLAGATQHPVIDATMAT